MVKLDDLTYRWCRSAYHTTSFVEHVCSGYATHDPAYAGASNIRIVHFHFCESRVPSSITKPRCILHKSGSLCLKLLPIHEKAGSTQRPQRLYKLSDSCSAVLFLSDPEPLCPKQSIHPSITASQQYFTTTFRFSNSSSRPQ